MFAWLKFVHFVFLSDLLLMMCAGGRSMISQGKAKDSQLKVKAKHVRLEGCGGLAIRGIPSKL